MISRSPSRWLAITAAGSGLLALGPLAVHAFLGSFSRYIADDFCTAGTLRRFGFLASQAYWYETWTGRYAYTFVVSLIQSVGPRMTPMLPAIAIGFWVLAVAFAVTRVRREPASLGPSLAVGAVVVVATLMGAPSVYQSLYWQTGVITYTLPLIGGAAYLGWLWGRAHDSRPRRGGHALRAASLLLAFSLGGFSETFVVLQTACLAILLATMAIGAKEGRGEGPGLAAAGLAGSLLAMATIAYAPGTQVRRALMPAATSLADTLEATLRDGYLFVARTGRGSPESIALTLLIPLALGFWWEMSRGSTGAAMGAPRSASVGALLLLPAITPGLMLSTIAPYEYAVSSYPDARVLITTMFVLTAGIAIWGLVLGENLASLIPRVPSLLTWAGAASMALVLATAALAFRESTALLEQAEAGRQYAISWETRDRKLRAAAGEPVPVPAASLRHMGGLAEIGRDPEEWINRCVADTYGLEAVVAK